MSLLTETFPAHTTMEPNLRTSPRFTTCYTYAARGHTAARYFRGAVQGLRDKWFRYDDLS